LPTTRTVTVEKLPASEQARVRELLDRGFWPAPDVQRLAHPKPSDFDITITVEDDARSKTIRLHRNAASPELQELLDLLEDQ
jgi:hypothetical protein